MCVMVCVNVSECVCACVFCNVCVRLSKCLGVGGFFVGLGGGYLEKAISVESHNCTIFSRHSAAAVRGVLCAARRVRSTRAPRAASASRRSTASASRATPTTSRASSAPGQSQVVAKRPC